MLLSEEHDGIIELSADAKIGAPAADALGLNDPVIDVAITPNRGDAASVFGIARDLAAAGLGTLKDGDGRSRRRANSNARKQSRSNFAPDTENAVPDLRGPIYPQREERPRHPNGCRTD